MLLTALTLTWALDVVETTQEERREVIPVPDFTLLDAPDEVVGGAPIEDNRWPDAAGIVFYGQYVGCTGVLVGPRTVITAAHCADGITHVKLDTNRWTARDGELIAAEAVIRHPRAASTYDIAVVRLAEASTVAPRPIAADCVAEAALTDGAPVIVVGYGSTRRDGNGGSSVLVEGTTFVQDADCSEARIDGMVTGCQVKGGEIGAGGNGVDACFGDSGGPLYLPTPDGVFVAGITSRGYMGVRNPCGEGGIYVRPDAVLPWIQRVSEDEIALPACNLPPEAEIDPIVAPKGGVGSTWLDGWDPEGGHVRFEIVEPPAHGTVEVKGERLVYDAEAGYSGPDAFVVAAVDDGNAEWPDYGDARTEYTVDVDVKDGPFACDTGGTPAQLGVLGLGLLMVRRRRAHA